jgi:hypothetical protein
LFIEYSSYFGGMKPVEAWASTCVVFRLPIQHATAANIMLRRVKVMLTVT